MNLWQVWLRLRLTPSRVRSLSVVGVAAVAVVADSKGNVVGSDLMGDLSRSLNDSLDNRGVSHSTNGSEGMDSREHRGSSVGESSENDSGVSLSLPLAIVAEAMVANSHGNSVCSNFMADLGRSHLNRLDDRVAGNSTNGGKAESCGSRDHGGSGVRESGENLRVGLRGGGVVGSSIIYRSK